MQVPLNQSRWRCRRSDPSTVQYNLMLKLYNTCIGFTKTSLTSSFKVVITGVVLKRMNYCIALYNDFGVFSDKIKHWYSCLFHCYARNTLSTHTSPAYHTLAFLCNAWNLSPKSCSNFFMEDIERIASHAKCSRGRWVSSPPHILSTKLTDPRFQWSRQTLKAVQRKHRYCQTGCSIRTYAT